MRCSGKSDFVLKRDKALIEERKCLTNFHNMLLLGVSILIEEALFYVHNG